MNVVDIVPAAGTWVLAAGAALLVTPLVKRFAFRVDVVSRPASDRWNQNATALLGGVGLFIAIAAGLALPAFFLGGVFQLEITGPIFGVLVAATIMFVVGLIDDLSNMRPHIKFISQVVAGIALVAFGAVLPLTSWYTFNVLLTLFWFVALTNAFNLLDNMDGIAVGVATVAAFFLGLAFLQRGEMTQVMIAWALAGATAGLLRYNFNPASIFMGDAGSLLIGALVAGLVASSSPSPQSTGFLWTLLVPLTIVSVPVLDTVLVTVTRMLVGRAISTGGRDHSTHRLVALGLSERQVAIVLYVVTAIGGFAALSIGGKDSGVGIAFGLGFLIAVGILASYLSHMVIRHPDDEPRQVARVLTQLLYRRRLGEIVLDAALVGLAFYGAFRLRFDAPLDPAYGQIVHTGLPLVIGLKIVLFGAFGVYRGAWRYMAIGDAYRIVAAVGLGTLLLRVFVGWQVPGLSSLPSILYIDGLLTASLIFGARLSFRSLDHIRRSRSGGERVLIYGAGDGGELALREIRNNKSLNMEPVCFLDDDVRKHGARLHGVPIIGGIESLSDALENFGVRTVVVGARHLSDQVKESLALLQMRETVDVLGLEISFHRLAKPDAAAGEPDEAIATAATMLQRTKRASARFSGAGR